MMKFGFDSQLCLDLGVDAPITPKTDNSKKGDYMSVVVNLTNPTSYVNVYVISGFSLNKSLIITNHTSNTLFIQQADVQPSTDRDWETMCLMCGL